MLPAKRGMLEMVKELIRNVQDIHANPDGATPLNLACFNDHSEIVKFLIENGANVNEKDEDTGESILHRVCEHGFLEVAKLLIQNGVDVSPKDHGDETPLHKLHGRARAVSMDIWMYADSLSKMVPM